ncbi:MAG: hypothetical protein H7211_15915 [Aquabacterium sp.]|nr:hypothetical protein [Ferruginibacter sp.]
MVRSVAHASLTKCSIHLMHAFNYLANLSKIDEDVTMQKIAKEWRVSYAWFRKMLKLCTPLLKNILGPGNDVQN